MLNELRRRMDELHLRRATAFERAVEPFKRSLFEGISGTVLEIGPGLGTNFRYLGSASRWIGVEPDAFLHEFLHEEARRVGLEPAILNGRAEQIEMPDESVDAVVSTLVLCSVDNPEAALAEIVRVLKPGGRFLFVEHVVADPLTLRRGLQKLARPLWSRVADGCRTDAETHTLIESAGFADVAMSRVWIGRALTDPHIVGVATKAR